MPQSDTAVSREPASCSLFAAFLTSMALAKLKPSNLKEDGRKKERKTTSSLKMSREERSDKLGNRKLKTGNEPRESWKVLLGCKKLANVANNSKTWGPNFSG
jgi:hypothetical protein